MDDDKTHQIPSQTIRPLTHPSILLPNNRASLLPPPAHRHPHTNKNTSYKIIRPHQLLDALTPSRAKKVQKLVTPLVRKLTSMANVPRALCANRRRTRRSLSRCNRIRRGGTKIMKPSKNKVIYPTLLYYSQPSTNFQLTSNLTLFQTFFRSHVIPHWVR